MTADRTEILYWPSDDGARSELVSSLEAGGYKIKTARRLEELLDKFDERSVKTLVVDASSSDYETNTRIVELSSSERLFRTPLVFFGRGVDGSFSTLGKQFVRFISLGPDSTVNDVLSEIDLILASSSSRSVPAIRGKATSATIDRLQLVPQLDPRRLVSSYGGSLFAAATRPSFFDDSLLLPKTEQRAKAQEALAEITRDNRMLGTRTRRVIYVSSALASGVGFTPEQDSTVRLASVLLGQALRSTPELAEVDFLHDEMETKAELVAGAIDNARARAKEAFSDARSERALNSLSEILRRRELFDSDDDIRVAQCLLLAEMAERACWKSGEWSANGAHRIIREFRHQSRYAIDPQIVSAMVRLLTEASCARYGWRGPSEKRKKRANEEMNRVLVAEAKREAEELFRDQDLQRIELPDMRAGMRLARPLMTLEGRLVLRANVRLDEAIIWGVWQLSTVAPLEKSISIDRGPTEPHST
ncbi:MAG: hypothetical protein IT290_12915 [Deltaproteobacteria bacterium]|nr:hypothetical protein [Deltaproteobacteria bacterium]